MSCEVRNLFIACIKK